MLYISRWIETGCSCIMDEAKIWTILYMIMTIINRLYIFAGWGQVIWIDSSPIPCQFLYRVLTQGYKNQAAQGGNIKTTSKSLSNILVSLQKSWNLVPRREQSSMPQQRRYLLTLSLILLPNMNSAFFQCQLCPQLCASRVGLDSHF